MLLSGTRANPVIHQTDDRNGKWYKPPPGLLCRGLLFQLGIFGGVFGDPHTPLILHGVFYSRWPPDCIQPRQLGFGVALASCTASTAYPIVPFAIYSEALPMVVLGSPCLVRTQDNAATDIGVKRACTENLALGIASGVVSYTTVYLSRDKRLIAMVTSLKDKVSKYERNSQVGRS